MSLNAHPLLMLASNKPCPTFLCLGKCLMHARAHCKPGAPVTCAGADTLRAIMGVLKDVLGKTPSASLLMDKYTKMVMVVDEVINEVGVLAGGGGKLCTSVVVPVHNMG